MDNDYSGALADPDDEQDFANGSSQQVQPMEEEDNLLLNGQTAASDVDEVDASEYGEGGNDRSVTDSSPVSEKALGKDIYPLPPKDTSGVVNSSWAHWEPDIELRPVRHMCFNIPYDFLASQPVYFWNFASFADGTANQRAASFAAVLGLLAISSKGYWPEDARPIEEEKLDVDKEKREEQIKKHPPLKQYLFWHSYTHRESDGAHLPYNYRVQDSDGECVMERYIAPMFSWASETLYSQRILTDEDRAAGITDDRGVDIGIRVHLLIWNPRFSTTTLTNQAMDENHEMQTAGRASRAPNSKRRKMSADAARQQREMVASNDMTKAASVKYATVINNPVLVRHLNMLANVDGLKGSSRPHYTDMAAVLGNNSVGAKLTADKLLGSRHSLAFESLMNIRRDDGMPLMAGMIDSNEVALNVHPRQADPTEYFDANTFNIKFPFEDSTYLHINYQEPLMDATIPNNLSSGLKVGLNMMKGFIIANERMGKVEEVVNDALRAIVHDQANRDDDDVDAWSLPPDESGIKRRMEHLRTNEDLPKVQTIFGKLLPTFISQMHTSNKVSAQVRRLAGANMRMPDSLDRPPGATMESMHESGCSLPGAGDCIMAPTDIAEIAAQDSTRLFEMLKRAKKIMLMRKGVDQDDDVTEWFVDATQEAIDWTLRHFDSIHMVSEFDDKLHPAERDVWRSTRKLMGKLAETSSYACVDHKDPNSLNGTGNVAFVFNKEMPISTKRTQAAGVSPYGAYLNEVSSFIYRVLGIQGRNVAGRMAMWYQAYEGVLPPGMREIIFVNGVRGKGKTLMLERFTYFFNREFDPATKRRWFHQSGANTLNALRAGGYAPASGGVQVIDEVPAEIVNADRDSPQAQEILEQIKKLMTSGSLERPRAMHTASGGENEWRRALWKTLDRSAWVISMNQGANATYSKEGVEGRVPGEEKRAFIDRTSCYPQFEKPTEKIVNDGDMKTNISRNRATADWLSVLNGLTYMTMAVIRDIPQLHPPNEGFAIAVWDHLDELFRVSHDIPLPDPRRSEKRRRQGLLLSIESAVVSVFGYKDTAVLFPDMQPIESDDDGLYVLRPFSITDLKHVIRIACYEPETLARAWSMGLDRNIHTLPEMHHILLAIGEMHGVAMTLCDSVLGSDGPASGDAAANTTAAITTTASGNDSDDDDPVGPSGDAATSQHQATDAHNKELTMHRYVPGFDSQQRTEAEIISHSIVIRKRRIAFNTFVERFSGHTNVQKRGQLTLDDIIRKFMTDSGVGAARPFVIASDNTKMFHDELKDLLLPTYGEVLDCGYFSSDIQNFLVGNPSNTIFDKLHNEYVFLGTHPSTDWCYRIRQEAATHSKNRLDPSWRTLCSRKQGSDQSATDDADQSEESGKKKTGSSSTLQGGWYKYCWDLSKKLTNPSNIHMEFYPLPPHHVFDRIVQFVYSEHKSNLQVSSTNDDGDSMRDAEVISDVEKVRGKSIADVCATLRQAKVVPTGVKIIPAVAAAFKTVATIDDEDDYHDAPKRRPEIMKWMKTRPNAVGGQRRLDKLNASGSLPAVAPLLSTTIERKSPLFVDDKDGRLYINSAWFVRLANLNDEIRTTLALIPGLRHSHGDRALRRAANPPGNIHVAVSSTTTNGVVAVGGAAASAAGPSGSRKAAVSGSRTEAAAPISTGNEAQDDEDMLANSANVETPKQNVRETIKLKTTNDPIFVEMRANGGEATDSHADQVLASSRTTSALFSAFDMNTCFYTFQANGLFVHDNKIFDQDVCTLFPRLFRKPQDVVLPEMITRFRTLPFENDMKTNPVLMLTSPRKRFAPPTAAASSSASAPDAAPTPRPRKRRQPTGEDLLSVRELHFQKTGDLLGEHEVEKLLALYFEQYCSSSGASEVSKPLSRAEWAKDLERCKRDAGMSGPGDEMMLIILDTGLGLLSQGIRYQARNRPRSESTGFGLIDSAVPFIDRACIETSTTALEAERRTVKSNLKLALLTHDQEAMNVDEGGVQHANNASRNALMESRLTKTHLVGRASKS